MLRVHLSLSISEPRIHSCVQLLPDLPFPSSNNYKLCIFTPIFVSSLVRHRFRFASVRQMRPYGVGTKRTVVGERGRNDNCRLNAEGDFTRLGMRSGQKSSCFLSFLLGQRTETNLLNRGGASWPSKFVVRKLAKNDYRRAGTDLHWVERRKLSAVPHLKRNVRTQFSKCQSARKLCCCFVPAPTANNHHRKTRT